MNKKADAYLAIAEALETASARFRELAAMQETTCVLDTTALVGQLIKKERTDETSTPAQT